MTTPNPVDFPELYDAILLAGKRSPGRARLSLPTRDEGWDVQTAKGTTGGTTVHNNSKPVEFDCEIFVWAQEDRTHWEDWEAFKPVLLTPVKANAPKALDIYHPQLDGLGIRSVVVKSWSEPQPDGKGGGTAKIKFLEYRPAKAKASASPGGSSGFGARARGNPPDPNADLKAQVAELTKKFQEVG